ncbi:helix-turn-helix domain-containing protein [Ruminococcaceae bacterium OttesenSCG-928-A11]|nr:helix-turn-helix domain-containing protein [Ruminococcaceae bacterium OttesenSCG-928-A11]
MNQDSTAPILTEYPDVLTVPHLREILGVGKNTVYDLLQDNKIKHVKVGRRYIVSKSNLIKFINNGN